MKKKKIKILFGGLKGESFFFFYIYLGKKNTSEHAARVTPREHYTLYVPNPVIEYRDDDIIGHRRRS